MKVKNYFWTLAAALALVGCSDDLENQKGGPEEGTEQAKGEYYLHFSLDTPETKASDNPTGGEEGDGNEAGTYAENYVENVALFFVEQTKGIQEAGAKIVGKLFIGEDKLTHPEETATTTNYVKTTEPILISKDYYTVIKDEIDKGNLPKYAVLAITNLANGDKNAFYTSITEGTSTVKDLQDAVIEEGNTNIGGKKGSFVMSSSGESYVTFEKYNNSKEFPAKLSVTVERLSARIDFKATKVDGEDVNVYPIYARNDKGEIDNKNKIASVTLTDMAVVNQFKGNVYDFKRVSVLGDDKNIIWLGDETPAAGVQTNYVLDFDFYKKQIDESKGGSLTMTDTERANIYDNHVIAYNPDTHKNLAGYWSTYFTGSSQLADDDTKYTFVKYVNENTTTQKAQKNGYSTGVVFKGTATILKAYVRTFSTDDEMSGDRYVTGIAWSEKKLEATDEVYIYKGMPYDNLETIQQLFVQKPIDKNLGGDVADKTATGWEFDGAAGDAVIKSIESLEALETYKGYFASTDLGYRKYLDEKYAELSQSTDINWTEVQQSISWDTYKINLTEDVLNNDYDIKCVKDNKTVDCYYPYWIRHSNNGKSDEMGIMEFGIVRNNIYKLSVKSLNGFGITKLHPDTPDEDDQLYLAVDLYVEDWVLRYNEDIEL